MRLCAAYAASTSVPKTVELLFYQMAVTACHTQCMLRQPLLQDGVFVLHTHSCCSSSGCLQVVTEVVLLFCRPLTSWDMNQVCGTKSTSTLEEPMRAGRRHSTDLHSECLQHT